MTFYDSHVHSCLSFDSDTQFEELTRLNLACLALTDHLEFNNPLNNNQNDPTDFDQLFKWKEELKEKQGKKLIAGVELGYVKEKQDQIEQILKQYDFDLVLLSCHHNGLYDYMDAPLIDCRENMVMNYVDDLLEMVQSFPKGQILSHFDYGFRVHNMSVDLIQPYKDKLVQVFKLMVENDIAFELNAQSIIRYKNRDLYEWAIPLYQKVGGRLFSLGSDAHRVEDLFLGFDHLILMLERYKVKEIVQVDQQRINLMPIEVVKKQMANKN